MEVAEVIIYVILTFILFILVGVIIWVVYDYYKYKDEQEIKLTNTFTKYKETDDSLTKDIKSSSNVLYTYSSNIDLNTSNYIKGINLATSNYIIESDKNYANNTSNYILDSRNKYTNNTSNFNNNLSKYFKFGTDDAGIGGFNNKLYEYTTWDPNKDGKLELINETTAAAGLRLKTTDVNGLNICDVKGENCYNLYINNSNLHIKAPTGGDIKWGGSESVDSFVKKSDSPVVTLDDAVVTAVNLTATNATTAAVAAATDADTKTTAANTATATANTARATRTGITQAIRTATSRAATNASLSAIQANNSSISAVMSADAEGVNMNTKNLALAAAVKANNSAKLASVAAVNAFTAAM
jgi:hypothetical protein